MKLSKVLTKLYVLKCINKPISTEFFYYLAKLQTLKIVDSRISSKYQLFVKIYSN